MQTHQKLADRFHSDPAFASKGIERSHDETDEPLAALWRFPQPGFGMAISARQRLGEAIHTAFGKPSLISQLPNTLGAVIEKQLENAMAFIRRVGREVARPDPSPEPYKEISTIRLLRRCASQIIDPKAGL